MSRAQAIWEKCQKFSWSCESEAFSFMLYHEACDLFEKRIFALDKPFMVVAQPSIDESAVCLVTRELERKCTSAPYSKATLQCLIDRFKNEPHYDAYWSDMDGNRIDETCDVAIEKATCVTIVMEDC